MFLTEQQFARFLYRWLAVVARDPNRKEVKELGQMLGLDLEANSHYLSRKREDGAVEIHAVRPTFRVKQDGRTKIELLVVLTQKRWCQLTDEAGQPLLGSDGQPVEFRFRGGCTLHVDPESGRIRYSIAKNIGSQERQDRNADFFRSRLADEGPAAFDHLRLRIAGTTSQYQELAAEPLALLHRNSESEAW
jgi:hypothetical protein